mgnify:CR=1 FL=1
MIKTPIRDVFVVLNPVAGLTNAEVVRQSIVRACRELGWDVKIHETSPDDDLRKIVKQAVDQRADLVIAAGGDGTVSGVASAMVNSGKPIGILPTGTGNVLARELGIPLNLEEALALLRGPNHVRILDAMQINGDYYVLNASIGISSEVIKETRREEKRRFGMLAYVWHAVRSILRSDMHRFDVRVDGRSYRFSATEVMITNTNPLGLPVMRNDLSIDVGDGRLDLFILRARNIRDYINILVKILLGLPWKNDWTLRYLEIRESAEVRTKLPLPVQADGEAIGHTPVVLSVVPGSLKIIVPERAAGTA